MISVPNDEQHAGHRQQNAHPDRIEQRTSDRDGERVSKKRHAEHRPDHLGRVGFVDRIEKNPLQIARDIRTKRSTDARRKQREQTDDKQPGLVSGVTVDRITAWRSSRRAIAVYSSHSSKPGTRRCCASCRACRAAVPSSPPATTGSARAAECRRGSVRRAASAALPYACRSC